MKNINELMNIEKIQETTNKRYSKEDYQKVTNFVASVYSLFAEYGGKIREEEFFKQQCRRHADKIIAMPNDADILNKIEKIVSVPNFPKLRGNYKTPEGVLNIACNAVDYLVYDYYQIEPVKSTTQALEAINERLKTPVNTELAKTWLEKLKNEL